MLAVLKTRWFAFGVFALVYVVTAVASVAWNHQREPRCGTADCMLLLKMTQDSGNAGTMVLPSNH